ncbi:unnamed protein product [Enterobius vermicularis]|uniref:Copper homeostasis protein cutC homolog n=1 Tax=Enterobius vermicularis TaxID=51028 RepID=A0A0N4UWS5_ENTVE|nr:unnamed protein product [Enterobius vermicularis]
MLRCRGGDFVYSDSEMDTMLEDLKVLSTFGADGFVFGALTVTNEVDIGNCQRITAAAKPLPVTFHRAFDHCNNWQKSINCIIDAGFSTILTRYHTVKFLSVAFKRQSIIPLQASYISFSSSSCKQKIVTEGVSLLREITKEYKGRIEIMAGSGVTPENISVLLKEAPDLDAVHSSASVPRKSLQAAPNTTIPLGTFDGNNQKETSKDIVSQLVAAAKTK